VVVTVPGAAELEKSRVVPGFQILGWREWSGRVGRSVGLAGGVVGVVMMVVVVALGVMAAVGGTLGSGAGLHKQVGDVGAAWMMRGS
jgi:hypothetical protein